MTVVRGEINDMADQVAQQQLTGAEEIKWDLSDLYPDADAGIEAGLTQADKDADRIAETYKGRIASLDAEEMRDLLEQYENLSELTTRAGVYAYLNWSTNSADPARGALRQKVTERGSKISQKLIFVDLEWANAPEDHAQALINHPVLAHYKHYLEVARQYRPYLLTEPEEKIMTEKSVTGVSAWNRFYNETLSSHRYEFDGQQVPMQVVLNKIREEDRDVRRRAADSVTKGLHELSRINTFVFNTLLADKASNDTLRKYPSWISSRNMANEVDDASVEALVEAVTSNYGTVARYYRLKKRLLGYDELFDYDRYAPLPGADRFLSWDSARDIILNAYSGFDQRMGDIASLFFENKWIDAAVVPNKQSGAYSMRALRDTHPYILMNYEGKIRDVTTLAHELGHGVHQHLYRIQGPLGSQTPLTTSETASVFGEMLVFQDLMRQETDPKVRLAMLTGKLEDSFATVFRQISMNRFEDAIHTARRSEGELTTERFSELWMETQRAMFEDSVTLRDDYGIWWSYVSHFMNVPGYVYAYAFGELLVLALYARYQEAPDGFADAYMKMLEAGSLDWPHELVKPLGIDLQDPNFWSRGLQILDDMVSEAETLAGE
jgi:oligoendopeptidase F